MAAIKGTILSDKISPGDTSATFPTHEDIYGKGGLMCVSTMDELTSLPLDRQKIGMLLYVNSNTHHYTLTSLSYPVTSYNVWESSIDLNNALIKNLYVGNSITPITGNRIVVNGGNIRINGIDLSNVPNITAFDTDGQSLFDLRSASPNANYNLSIASSGIGNFMKFFGGRELDPNPFIVVKKGSPLRIASYSNFYNSNNDFTEHMRVDTQTGNVGIGTQNPTQKLSVNGTISSNNIICGNSLTVLGNTSLGAAITSITLGDAAEDTFTLGLTLDDISPNPANTMLVMARYTGGAGDAQRSPNIKALRSRGTSTSAVGVSAGDALMSIRAFGMLDGGIKPTQNSPVAIQMWAAEKYTSTAQGSYITFRTQTSGSSLGSVERMRIDHTGNVGIGTTNPLATLTVNGSISANDITVTNNLSTSVHITDLTSSKTFLSSDTCRVFHFDTTTQPLFAIFPSSLPDGFNVALMNTGTNILRLSAAQLNSVGVTIGVRYGGAFVYKDNNQLFAVGRL